MSANETQAFPVARIPFRYWMRGMYYRAMMVAYFYDEEKFADYAAKMFQQVEWGVLEEKKKAAT